MYPDEEVAKWMKRLNRKGPFYLLRTEPYHYEVTRQDGSLFVKDGTTYVIIWNDGDKTKLGSVHDHMWCRYGVSTRTVLNGDRPHDLWNGAGISDEEFQEMLAVRKNSSTLPIFQLETLKNLTH